MKDSFASDQQPDLTNKDNFDWIFREHYLMLKNYAWQYVFEQSIAEDIVQDVFIHLWERRHSLQLKVSIKSYLYTSVYNRCLNHIKHEKVSLKFKKVKSDEDKIKQAYYDNLSANKEKYFSRYYLKG
jgi:RNA polymerase sigma-70 factor (ECF subfamily)